MKKLLVLAVLAVSLIATPAMARQVGAYLGIGLTYVNIVSTHPDFETVNAAIGRELRVGYNTGSIAFEGNLISSTHPDDATGFSDGDFTGLNIDLRLSFSEVYDPSQVYFLVGLGTNSFEQTGSGNSYKFTGSGVNIGVGVEHFFNPQVAIDIRGVYRLISYDLVIDGSTVETGIDGDTLTLGAALNLHF